MTARSKYFDLEYFEGHSQPYSALCRFCLWEEEFTSKRAARAAFVDHDCYRELPERPLSAIPNWSTDARCAQPDVNSGIFFDPAFYDDAIATCNTCTVRASCLFTALEEERRHIAWGVRGGLLPEERTALARIRGPRG